MKDSVLKSNAKSFIIVAVFVLAASLLIKSSDETFTDSYIKKVKIGGEDIKVELADTPAKQAQGLSGRSGLPEGEGMLFVFEYPGKYYFWMKDMNFPIDMIWIGEDLRILYIQKGAKPEEFLDTYGPDALSKYVLEVNAGFADKKGLNAGDQVKFEY